MGACSPPIAPVREKSGRRMLYKNNKYGLLLVLALSGFFGSVGAEESRIITLQERLAALQSGSLFMVMRHAATDHNQKDIDRGASAPCSMQRNLSEEGREDMRSLKRSIEHLGIKIDKVYASPYCRTRHTAEEAFGDYEVLQELEFSMSKDQAESKRLGEFLCRQLRSTPLGVGNTVFVTHTSNVHDCLGVWPKVEGVALVVERQGERLIYKGMINPEDWPVVKE